MSKAYFANVLDRIRDGVERFWIFHCCAVFFALLVVQRNHGIVDASTLRQLAFGICWGLLPGCSFSLPASGVGGVCATAAEEPFRGYRGIG